MTVRLKTSAPDVTNENCVPPVICYYSEQMIWLFSDKLLMLSDLWRHHENLHHHDDFVNAVTPPDPSCRCDQVTRAAAHLHPALLMWTSVLWAAHFLPTVCRWGRWDVPAHFMFCVCNFTVTHTMEQDVCSEFMSVWEKNEEGWSELCTGQVLGPAGVLTLHTSFFLSEIGAHGAAGDHASGSMDPQDKLCSSKAAR